MNARSRESGFTLITMALCLVAFIGIIGLAIDVARVYIAKNEVQTFADSASLAATLELDGTWNGIYRALSRVSSNPNLWSFATAPVATTSTSFATTEAGPWTATPNDPTGYRLARVVA